MSVTDNPIANSIPVRGHEVLARVRELVPTLRARAPQTERLRQMHPESLRDLTSTGVFRLVIPADVGGFEADDAIVADVLTEIARGCPSTGWICAIMLSGQPLPALLGDNAADEVYETPDLRITVALAPSGTATPIAGGYRISGEWKWNSGGVHSNWIAVGCMTSTDNPMQMLALLPVSQVVQHDTWYAAGLAGSASNSLKIGDAFVPSSRTLPVKQMNDGDFPARRYSTNPYFNRPWVMFASFLAGATVLGMGKGALRS